MNMSTQRKIGLLLAVIHLILFFWFISYLTGLSARDGQSQLLWIYWLALDFPVSLFVFFLSFALESTSHYVMYFVHGVLGAVWWFFVPTILYKGYRKIVSLMHR